MIASAQLSVRELRRAARHPTDYIVTAEHRKIGEVQLHIINVSAQGFMVRGLPEMGRGERFVMTLPVIGRIEAHLVWVHDDRAGFQFERIIRNDEFMKLIDALQKNIRLRRSQ